jgi:hypothetical protein
MASLLINGEKIKGPEKGAGWFFNSFFLSIAENLNLYQVGKEDPIYFLKDVFSCKFHGIKIVPTSEAEIQSIILSRKSKNSSCHDEITSKIMKACVPLISRSLCHIHYHPLYTGVFPNSLKISIVGPLFRIGDKISMINYRPISLSTVSSKVMEKVICNRLSHHMHTNNILVPEQFGFRQEKSTGNAASKLTNSVFKSINQKNACWGNTVWFSKSLTV